MVWSHSYQFLAQGNLLLIIVVLSQSVNGVTMRLWRVLRGLTGFERLWQALAGFGGLWRALAGFGGYWETWRLLRGFDWLWRALTGSNCGVKNFKVIIEMLYANALYLQKSWCPTFWNKTKKLPFAISKLCESLQNDFPIPRGCKKLFKRVKITLLLFWDENLVLGIQNFFRHIVK